MEIKRYTADVLDSLNVVSNYDFLGVQTFKSCQPF